MPLLIVTKVLHSTPIMAIAPAGLPVKQSRTASLMKFILSATHKPARYRLVQGRKREASRIIELQRAFGFRVLIVDLVSRKRGISASFCNSRQPGTSCVQLEQIKVTACPDLRRPKLHKVGHHHNGQESLGCHAGAGIPDWPRGMQQTYPPCSWVSFGTWSLARRRITISKSARESMAAKLLKSQSHRILILDSRSQAGIPRLHMLIYMLL